MVPITRRRAGVLSLLLVQLLLSHVANGQSTGCISNTGTNATFFVEIPDDQPSAGYVRAYATDGTCVGQASLRTDEIIALAIWGDDTYTDGKAGLNEGEEFTVSLITTDQQGSEVSSEIMFVLDDSESYYDAVPVYKDNGIYQVASMSVASPAGSSANVDCRSIAAEAPHSGSVLLYPNPASTSSRIQYSAPTGSNVSITSYDLVGRLVSTIYQTGNSAGGEQVMQWDTSSLADGAYVVRVETECGVQDRVLHVLN